MAIGVFFICNRTWACANNYIKEFLRRGGLRCEILSSGTISIGDEIKIL